MPSALLLLIDGSYSMCKKRECTFVSSTEVNGEILEKVQKNTLDGDLALWKVNVLEQWFSIFHNLHLTQSLHQRT